MIDIPEYGNIAYTKHESAHPEMWPVHAWCPSVQKGGNVVQDFCGRAHATMNGTWDWNPDMPGIRTLGTSNYGSLASGSLSDMNPDQYTVDVVLYGNGYLPTSGSHAYIYGESANQNALSLRCYYPDYSNYFIAYPYKDGYGTGYSDSVTVAFGRQLATAGDRFHQIIVFRLTSSRTATLKAYTNDMYDASSTAEHPAMDWSSVVNIFGRSGATTPTYFTVLSLALHNRIIDEPMNQQDPMQWLRKHKRKYYRAFPTSGPNLAAAVYYYQRMIAG